MATPDITDTASFIGLEPPYLNGSVTPLLPVDAYPDYAWGFGLDDFSADTVPLSVNAWRYLAPGDRLELYISDTTTPIASTVVSAAQVDEPQISLPLSKSRLNDLRKSPAFIKLGRADRLSPVFVKLVRAVDGKTFESDKINVLYLPDRPAGLTLPAGNYHSNLSLTLQGYTPGTPLDAWYFAQPFVISIPRWTNIRAGDRIRLFWNKTEIETPPVTQAQVTQTEFLITIPADIVAASRTGTNTVYYGLQNVVGTLSGEKKPWSAPLVLEPSTAATPGDGPDVEYDLEAVPFGEPIDIDKRPVYAVINLQRADRPVFVSPKTLEVRVEGTTAQGQAVSVILPVTLPARAALSHRVLIPNNLLLSLHNRAIVLSYILRDGSKVLKESGKSTYQIKGSLRDLPAPVIVGGYVADPSKPVQILFPAPLPPSQPIATGDGIKVIISASGFVPRILNIRLAGALPRSQQIAIADLAPFAGSTNLKFEYQVISGSTVRQSLVLQTLLGPATATSPGPTLAPLSAVSSAQAYVTLSISGSFAEGENVIITSSPAGTGPKFDTVITLHAAVSVLTVDVPTTYIRANRGQTLTFNYLRTLNGQSQLSESLRVTVPATF